MLIKDQSLLTGLSCVVLMTSSPLCSEIMGQGVEFVRLVHEALEEKYIHGSF